MNLSRQKPLSEIVTFSIAQRCPSVADLAGIIPEIIPGSHFIALRNRNRHPRRQQFAHGHKIIACLSKAWRKHWEGIRSTVSTAVCVEYDNRTGPRASEHGLGYSRC